MIRLFLVVFAVLIVSSKQAHAYIDPGTVSIVLQAAVGAIAAGGLFFRVRIVRFLGSFRRRPGPEASPRPPKTLD